MKTVLMAAVVLAAALQAPPLDSQVVIERYARSLLHAALPKVLVFSYTVSQAGPHDIEQAHRIYRSGDLVRDETLLVDGAAKKTIRIARYRNRYALDTLAPSIAAYTFLFQTAQRSGSSIQYAFRAIPNAPRAGFVIDEMVLDGKRFLPLLLRFHDVSASARGRGTIAFGRAGRYWVPLSAMVEGSVNGKPAREHIAFSAYSFPMSLPKSTFQAPKPLPTATLPTFSAALRTQARIAGWCAWLLPLALYAFSISSAVAYWDTGEAQTVPWIFGIMHPTGFPVFTILAGLFAHVLPIGTVAWRIGLFSALAMSGAAWFVYRTVVEPDGDPWFGCAGAWLFSFGEVAWTRGTRAEVHSLAVFFALAALCCSLRWLHDRRAGDLVLGALAFGLGVATHPIVALLLPALLLVLSETWRSVNARTFAAALLALLAGMAFYAYLPVRSAAVTAARFDPTLKLGIPAGRPFWDNDHPAARRGLLREVGGSEYGAQGTFARMIHIRTYKAALPHYADVLFDELTPIGILLALGGFVRLWLRDDATAVVALLAYALPTAFALAYTIEADPLRYQLIGFAVLCVLAGCGGSWIARLTRAPHWSRAVTAAAIAAVFIGLNHDTFAQRDSSGARAVIDAAIQNTPRNAILISSWSVATPLAYGAYVEHRLGARILETAWLSEDSSRIRTWIRRRPIFVMGPNFGEAPGYRLKRIASDPDIYRIVPSPDWRPLP